MNLLSTSYDFLNHKEKLNLLTIFFLIIISSFLEMIGIGLILPLLTAIVDNNFFNNNEIVGNIKNQFNINSKNQFIIIIILAIVIANFGKAFFLTISSWKQINDVANINKRFTNQMYLEYINSDWKFLVNKNPAIILRNIYISTQDFTDKVLTRYLLLATEIIMIIFILSLLIYVNPSTTLIAIIFCAITGYLAQKITKKYNYQFGLIRQKYLALRQKHILETFKAIKLIKILNKVIMFNKNYLDLSSKEIKAKSDQEFFNRLPRIWIEFLSILIMCFIIIYIVKYYGNISSFLPTIGLYIVASYKLLPSLVKILNLIQTLRFARPVVANLVEEINDIKKVSLDLRNDNVDNHINKDFRNSFKKNIIIQNLNFSYDINKKIVFENFNYDIEKNKILGIVGESGSGKSTFVDLLTGINKPKSGKILIDGNHDIFNHISSWQNMIGYVPQETYLLDDTIKNNICYGINPKNINIDNLKNAIDLAQIKEFIEKQPDKINTFIGYEGSRISGGQLQRIGIARALYSKPSVLILDEPTSSLDRQNEEQIINSLFSIENITVIVISHNQNILKKCDQVLNLENHS